MCYFMAWLRVSLPTVSGRFPADTVEIGAVVAGRQAGLYRRQPLAGVPRMAVYTVPKGRLAAVRCGGR